MMKEQTLRFGEPFVGTVVCEDPEQEALRVEVQDPSAQYTAFVRWACAEGVSTDDYPIMAFCIKLGRPDLKFHLARWRMDRYAEMMEILGGPHTFWSIFPTLKIEYEPTTDWQLVIMDGTPFKNPNFDGNWTDLGLVLAQKDGTLQQGDHVWLKWVGMFASVEAAKAYYSYGKVFEDATPLFWHAESAPVVEKPRFPVISNLSPKKAAERISNYGVKPCGKIPSECSSIFPFDENQAFAHHPGVTAFKNKIIVSWSSGERDEDVAGQHMRVACTSDFKTWSEPHVVAPPRQATYGPTAALASHIFATDDKVYAYFVEKEYGPACFNEDGTPRGRDLDNAAPGDILKLRMMRAETEDGLHWTEPVEVTMSHWTNEAPRPSAEGRLFAGAGPRIGRTDNPNGFDIEIVGPSNEQIENARRRGAPILTEGTWFQTDEGIIRLFLRSNAGQLWMSESYDNGDTWTDIYPTNFAEDTTMAHMGRLPDGRYYFVGTPVYNNGRFPLALCISEDGYFFDKMYIIRDEVYEQKVPGWAKGGQYGYPEVCIKDGYMYIAYSRMKEIMGVTRIKLSDIQ